ncbi:hypothetical protein AAC387_Pa09g2277 [Persea americana]
MSELVRKRKVILGIGASGGGEVEANATRRKRARSSSSSGREMGMLRAGGFEGRRLPESAQGGHEWGCRSGEGRRGGGVV